MSEISPPRLPRPALSPVTFKSDVPRIGRFAPKPPWRGTSIVITLPATLPVAAASFGYWTLLQFSEVVVVQPFPGTALFADLPLPAKNVSGANPPADSAPR